MCSNAQRLLKKIADARSFRNPFVGARNRWYEIDAATMRAIRKAVRS